MGGCFLRFSVEHSLAMEQGDPKEPVPLRVQEDLKHREFSRNGSSLVCVCVCERERERETERQRQRETLGAMTLNKWSLAQKLLGRGLT